MGILTSCVGTCESGGGGASGPGVPSKVLLFHGSNEPVEYGTITTAIAAAVFADVIMLPPGTWDEAFDIPVGVNVMGFNRETILVKTVGMAGGGIHGVAIMPPAGEVGIDYYGTAGNIGRVESVQFLGSGSGTAINNRGTTNLILQDINFNGGVLDYFLDTAAGSYTTMDRCVTHESAAVNEVSVRCAGNLRAVNCKMMAPSPSHQWFFNGNAGATLVGCAGYNAALQGFRLEDTSDVVLNGCSTFNVFQSVAIGGAAVSYLTITNCNFFSYSGYDIGLDWAAVGSYIRVSNSLYELHWGPEEFYASSRWLDNHTGSEYGREGFFVENDLAVGTESRDANFYYGEGRPYNTFIKVLHFDNVNGWSDKTPDALDYDVAWSPFSGEAGDSLYIGVSDPYAKPFTGLELDVVTKANSASLIAELFDGSAWVDVPCFSTDQRGALEYTGETPWLQAGAQNARLGDIITSSALEPVHAWDEMAQTTVNEVSAYWIRFTPGDTAAGSCVVKNLKLWGHSGKKSRWGEEVFGDLIKYRQVQGWSILSLKEINGAAPSRSDVRIAQNIRLNNMWTLSGSAYDALGGSIPLPTWADQGRGMSLDVTFSTSTSGSGDVEIINYSALTKPGDIFDGTLPSTETKTITHLDAVDEKSYRQQIYGMITGAGANADLALTFGRDGGNGNDSYGGNIRLVSTVLRAHKYLIT